MKKDVWTFGLIAGGILAAMMVITLRLSNYGAMEFDHAELFGYTTMVLAFVLIFFAIRSYRENVGGGAITFGKALQVGLLVTLIASTVYVATWEILYYNVVTDFGDKYAAHQLEKMRAKGATDAAMEKAKQDMVRFKELYKNPFINAGITYLEVFPVGLIITFIFAGILRRKMPPGGPAGMAVAG